MNAEKRQGRYLGILQPPNRFGVEERFQMPPGDAVNATKPASSQRPISVVLASASPRRLAILKDMGLSFEVDVPTHPEPDPTDFPTVEQFVTHAAYCKA